MHLGHPFAAVTCYLLVAALASCVLSSAVSGSSPVSHLSEGTHIDEGFIGVEEIRPGAVGIGKTVFSGTTIEEFGVEVLAVLHQGNASHPYIMIRVFGETVEGAGGIVDGMSGSPVYFDGRLAGAISHVYTGAGRDIGLVTPIEPMLQLLSIAPDHERDSPFGASPANAHLMVSGMSGRSLEMACSALTGHRYVVAAASAIQSAFESPDIVPGSAVSVQLVDGDIEIASVGTVTYAEANAFVAFGHHFEAAGTVDYIASSAEIVGIVKSEEGPFKVAAPLKRVGRVTQDRFTGLAGTLGTEAETTDVVVNVTDTETRHERTYEFSVIRDERFVYSLITAGVLEAFDATLGRIGEGTSTVSMSMQLSSGPTVTRSNTFSDRSDIAMWSLSEISEAVSLIAFNDCVQNALLAITIEADISPEIRTARIEAVEVDSDAAGPGDCLKAEVVIRPYRSPAIAREVEITVPADASPGYAYLSVRGGSDMFGAYIAEPLSQPTADYGEPGLYSPDRDACSDLDSHLAEFSTRPKSTDLILDLYLPGPVATEVISDEHPDQERLDSLEPTCAAIENDDEWPREDEQEDRTIVPESSPPAFRGESPSPVRVVVPLDWVIYGYEELEVEITAASDDDSETE